MGILIWCCCLGELGRGKIFLSVFLFHFIFDIEISTSNSIGQLLER
jgi:hypothetical protein